MVSEQPISNESEIQIITMSSASEQNPNTSPNTQHSSATEKSLIAFNITAQINEKLTPSTFLQWRAQFEALLIGYDLLDYEEGILQCLISTGTAADELCKTHWIRQDKLILSAILASTSPSITPLIATAKTSHDAWNKLKNLYASRSRTRAMQLKEELTLIQRGARSMTEYLHTVKALADEIAIIDHPISDDDLTLYVLNGLGPDFREIAAPIRAREKSLVFEELHDLLVGHEAYLRRLEVTAQQLGSHSIMDLHVTIGGPITIRASPTISTGGPSPSVNSVINGDILQNHVHNIIPLMLPSTVSIHQVEWIKIGY